MASSSTSSLSSMTSSGSLNFGGLISGLDTDTLIENLMTVESKPLTRLENQKTDLTGKKDTYTSMKTQLLDLNTSISGLKSSASFGAFSASSSDEEALTLSASSTANAGTYKVKILTLAQAETLSSDSFSEINTRLGLKGEILVNGESVSIRNTDTLTDIRNSINSLDAGVTASILQVTKNDYRLIISAENQGSDGLNIANVGATDNLGNLGFTDGTKSIRSISNNKVLSSAFNSTTSTIGSLTGISSNVSGTVGIRGQSIDINLSKDTLSSIRDKINDLGLQGVEATIESDSDSETTLYYLAITGTENFNDDNNILETLGILEGGKSGVSTTYETAALSVNKSGNTAAAEQSTKLTELGANLKGSSNETITISGTDSDGNNVSQTLTITTSTTVDDVLTAIESAFSDDVTAKIEDGKIVIESTTSGASSLTFNMYANNENDGTLDFGTVTQTAKGRARQVVAGTDSIIVVNNIQVTRSTNEIDDVLTGLNLTLKQADADTTLTITVERDTSEVQKKIENFIEKYNTFIDYVNENSKYDNKTKEAGVLLGDSTTTSIVRQLRSALGTTVYGNDTTFNHLSQIGITTTDKGKLSLDASTLKDAMEEDMDSVISLFTATRESSDSDISFVYHSEKSQTGTYDVAITRAAEKATALSDSSNSVNGGGSIQITDNYGSTLSVDYTKDMTLTDIANAITSEAEKSYAGIFLSSTELTTTDNETATQTTKISDISGAVIEDNDTITINATTRSGKEYQRILTLDADDRTTTVQTILDTIEDISDDEVNATVDAYGRIQIQDTEEGTNKFKFSIQTTVEGLDFGDFTTIQEGRSRVTVEATVTSDNRLSITQLNYGSKNTFTISGAENIGINDGDYAGVDIAGTINGVEGTGSGRTLTASSSDSKTRGIVINSEITPEELAEEGSSQGTITLISGVADLLYSVLQSTTNSVSGFLQAKIDGYDRSISTLDSRIDTMNERLEKRREMYVKKFTQLELAMTRLKSMQSTLTNSLGTTSLTSLLSS